MWPVLTVSIIEEHVLLIRDVTQWEATALSIMPEPHIPAKTPIKVALEAGKTYFFCTCGHSTNQPFCDGSHKGTGFAPEPFESEKDGDAFLCQCKHTGNVPFCDSSHSKL